MVFNDKNVIESKDKINPSQTANLPELITPRPSAQATVKDAPRTEGKGDRGKCESTQTIISLGNLNYMDKPKTNFSG